MIWIIVGVLTFGLLGYAIAGRLFIGLAATQAACAEIVARIDAGEIPRARALAQVASRDFGQVMQLFRNKRKAVRP